MWGLEEEARLHRQEAVLASLLWRAVHQSPADVRCAIPIAQLAVSLVVSCSAFT
ncbi:unnamed protein product, partial [Rangifer tarandus platyrhynchus]